MNIGDVDALLTRSRNLLTAQKERRDIKAELEAKIENLREQVQGLSSQLDIYNRGLELLGSVTDKNMTESLKVITGVINRALEVIFPTDPRAIYIEHIMYRDVYPHFVVTLVTGKDRKKRTFKQSGSGLAQVVSLLFTVSLVDARKGRRFMAMDELLRGLHPIAKRLMRDLLRALSHRFQFVIVEYGMDIGRQYEAVKLGATSRLTEYGTGYYKDLALKGIEEDYGTGA